MRAKPRLNVLPEDHEEKGAARSRRPRGLGLVPKDAVILTPAPCLSPLDKETLRHWLGLGIIRACNQNRPTNGRGSASLNTAFGLFWFWRGFSPSGGSEVTKKTPASAPTRFQEKAPTGSAGLISAFRWVAQSIILAERPFACCNPSATAQHEEAPARAQSALVRGWVEKSAAKAWPATKLAMIRKLRAEIFTR